MVEEGEVAGEVPEAMGDHRPSASPYGAFACSDGVLRVVVGGEAQWSRFAGLLGLGATDPRFCDNASRVRHRAELAAEGEAVLKGATRDEWLDKLGGVGVPCGAVRTVDQVYEWEQTRSQGLVLEVDHPVLGRVELPGSVPCFAPHAGGEDLPTATDNHLPPPSLGEHDDRVRAWLDGLDERWPA